MSDLRDTDNTDELDPTKRPPLRDNLGMGPVKVAAPMGGPSLVPPIGRPISDTGVPMYNQGDATPPTGTAPAINPHIAKAQELEQEGSGVSQVQAKHPFWGGVLRGLDVAASIAAPRIAPEIPGTTAHHNALIGQQEGLANQDIAQQEKQAQTQDVQSQIPLRQAQTQDTEAQTEERRNPKPQLEMTDEGLVRVPQQGEATPVTIAGSGDTLMKPSAPDKPENAQLQAENAWLSRPENKGKDLADAQKWYTALSPQARQEFHISTPRDRGVIMAVPDGKGGTVLQEIQPGQAVPSGSTTATQLGGANVKAETMTADEQRRHDLAENLNENLNQLEDIARRRPELFGPGAGRLTQAKNWIGSSDPDVAALGTIKEMVGQAMLGAHSMRAAQHIEAAGNAIINAYKTDPNALLSKTGPIAVARRSIQTFLNEKQGVQPQGAAAPSGGTNNADPLGILH